MKIELGTVGLGMRFTYPSAEWFTPCGGKLGKTSGANEGINWIGVRDDDASCKVICLFVERNSKYYLYRFASFISVLSFMGPAVFEMDSDSIADRFGYLSTLLLAVVAMLFVIDPNLPKLGFLTLFDKYFLSVVALLVLQAFVTLFMSLSDAEAPERHKHTYMGLAATALLHAIFLVESLRAFRSEQAKLIFKNHETQLLQGAPKVIKGNRVML